jgi:hypothetical protein
MARVSHLERTGTQQWWQMRHTALTPINCHPKSKTTGRVTRSFCTPGGVAELA